LQYNTNYYWYVVENGDTCSVTGPTWSFRTEPDPGIILSWADNFDTYTAGLRLACQNPIDWTTWTLIPCSTVEDPLISNTQSYSAPNSFVIVQNNDLVYPIGDLTSGKYSISFRIYLTNDKLGYFNTLSNFTGGVYEWAMECFFKAGGQGSLNAGGIGVASFTYSYNNWNLVELIVDIDNDAAELKFNGTSIFTWPWSAGASGNGSQLKLSAIDFFGETDQYQMYVDDFTFTDLLFAAVEDSNEVNVNAPVTYSLDQNYPNPFNPSTVISYQLPVSGLVSLKVYDVLGNEVITLVNQEKPVGNYEVNFNASSLASGIYYYQLRAGSFVQTKKMLYLK
jgi:hypothetical protein